MKKIARISGIYKSSFKAIMDGREINCKLAGYVNSAKEELPAVGDYVNLDDNGYIMDILPRKNQIVRKAAGKIISEEQVLAVNVDHAFVVTSLNNEFNLQRIERYITFLEIQNIDCRLVFAKADLCDDIDFYLEQAQNLGQSSSIIVTSIADGKGFDEIAALLSPGKTAVFLGSSGVGKSSIINYLVGGNAQKVKEISAHGDKGRHTTTHREMFVLENGACIIDTPGMREIQLWGGEGDITSFADIDDLSANCKFRNCKHDTEPDCAVKGAINGGTLSPRRLANYRKLEREVRAAKLRNRVK